MNPLHLTIEVAGAIHSPMGRGRRKLGPLNVVEPYALPYPIEYGHAIAHGHLYQWPAEATHLGLLPPCALRSKAATAGFCNHEEQSLAASYQARRRILLLPCGHPSQLLLKHLSKAAELLPRPHRQRAAQACSSNGATHGQGAHHAG